MPISYEEVVAIRDGLQDKYQDRHEAFGKLRDYYHGRYWDRIDGEEGIASVFRDMISARSDVGPDVKIVHNVLQQVCVKYQTYLAPLPMIRMYTDPPYSQKRRAQATKKERYLYGLWAEGGMGEVFTKAAWYLPLFGHCYLGVFPNFDRNIPIPILRSPEHAYPVMGFDGNHEDAVIFEWEAPASAAKRAFPAWSGKVRERRQGPLAILRRRGETRDPKVKIVEWSDKKEWGRWVEGEKVNGVEHGYGFNLFDPVKFIDVPDEPWGHGAVEQTVNLVELGNALYSLLWQNALDNVFSPLVLEDPMKAPEEIDKGPGGVIPLNAGGRAYYLNPPVQATQAHQGFLAQNELNVKQGSSMPDVNFGNFRASIVTGKAINELQGAGTGSLVEMVQGSAMGPAVVNWNQKAIFMAQEMFRDDTANLFGTEVSPTLISARRFALSVKGKDLIGSPRNEVVFAPHMGLHDKLVMALQAQGAGLTSKQSGREQIGIPDSEAMEEEILRETIQDGMVGAILAAMQEPTPEAAEQAFTQASSFIEGGTPHPLLTMGQPSLSPPGPTGSMSSPPLQLPPGAPAPTGGLAPPPEAAQAQGGTGEVTLDEVAGAIDVLEGIEGRVFIVGELAATGVTREEIELAVTEAEDRETLAGGLSQWRDRLVFRVVRAEPSEEHVEVTPGAGGTRGGESEALAGLIGV